MHRFILAILMVLAALAFTPPVPAPVASEDLAPDLRAAYDRAAADLLCYCGCARQTIKECTCGVAFDLRSEFESRLKAGETADAIIASYIAQHGEQTRNTPPKSGLNLVAWFGPGIGIVLSGIVTLLVLRRWALRGRTGPAAQPAEAASAEDDAMARRIEKDLKELDL